MGNCTSAASVLDSTSLPEDAPHCALCGERGNKPLRKLRREAREEWVEVGGQLRHRRCQVAFVLEDARYRRQRASYSRAKRLVYPSSTAACQAQAAGSSGLHRVGSGQEWAHSDSFRLPYSPSQSVISLEHKQCSLTTTDDASIEQTASASSSAVSADCQQQQRWGGGTSEGHCTAGAAAAFICSAASSTASGDSLIDDTGKKCNYGSSGGGGPNPTPASTSTSASPIASSSSQGGGGGDVGNCRCSSGQPGVSGRPCLRRPSPIHHPALLEAKTLRRLQGLHPTFDSEAMKRDPDGANSKLWRLLHRRPARPRDDYCDCNGIDC